MAREDRIERYDHASRVRSNGQAFAHFIAAGDGLIAAIEEDDPADHLATAQEGVSLFYNPDEPVPVDGEDGDQPDILDELLAMEPQLRFLPVDDVAEEDDSNPVPDTLDRVLATGNDLQADGDE